jgi:hypothetical protein
LQRSGWLAGGVAASLQSCAKAQLNHWNRWPT